MAEGRDQNLGTILDDSLRRLEALHREDIQHLGEVSDQYRKTAVDLARLEIALVLQVVVAAKVAVGEPSREEQIIWDIASLISESNGDVTKAQLLEIVRSKMTASK